MSPTATNAMPMVVAGETLVDMILRPDGLIDPKLGGSPFNFALALARLGCKVQYANPLSLDTFGQRLHDTLTQAKVGLRTQRSGCPTSLACVTVDAQGHPSYAFYRDGVADRDWNPLGLLDTEALSGAYFHVGSLVLIPPDGALWIQVLAGLRAKGVVTSVDVNMRLVAAADHPLYLQTVKNLMPYANVLKVSDEDLRALRMEGDPLSVARTLLSGDTRLVVLTLGAQGAWALTAEHEVFQAPVQVRVVDSVGAGDCFYAGFTCALAEMACLTQMGRAITPTAGQLAQALAFANQVTGFNLQHQGCVPPWRAQLSE